MMLMSFATETFDIQTLSSSLELDSWRQL